MWAWVWIWISFPSTLSKAAFRLEHFLALLLIARFHPICARFSTVPHSFLSQFQASMRPKTERLHRFKSSGSITRCPWSKRRSALSLPKMCRIMIALGIFLLDSGTFFHATLIPPTYLDCVVAIGESRRHRARCKANGFLKRPVSCMGISCPNAVRQRATTTCIW